METLIQGLLLGGLYALFAQGLSVMFGVMRLTNIAQGDFIVLAAFGGIALAPLLGGHPLWVLLLLLPLGFGAGWALQAGVLNRTLGRDPLPSLVVTFGLSVVVQNGLQELFSADPRSLTVEGLGTSSLALGDISIGVLPLLILGVALLCTAGLQALFSHTPIGRAFRAVSDDRDIAELMGLDARRVCAMATGLAFALIVLAGLLQSMRTTVAPTDGPTLLLFAFEAVIIGGLGSFWGTLTGALVLGVAQQVGFQVDPGWGLWFGHLVFLAVLVVRPQGLFPKTRGG
ncbi:amino acid/amide ABC transporter membrane protein 1 (HAAT family) [Sphaerotilus hippei]|uniref:Amino acid/amide ABC transporter membrane protein 1 (HAAT family) n=1 Tax=Sphaerotilus hippei TaxID=744406 RepID=A0A318H304_9BURK|nr:branched-chain amino acid ABC transporter permease [Sphaerotilus hippei]PXW97623.1 amino acid/amide ABC transporter membrane protein 1 (HAAT family) [Sphaerotilus hippei]